MTTQVLCVMENHSRSSTYYPLESTIFSTEYDNDTDKECESSESTLDVDLNPTLKKEENQQLKKRDVCEECIVLKETPPPKEDWGTKIVQCRFYSACITEKNYLVTFREVRNVTVGILSGLAQTIITLLDFIIGVCMNKGVHNVLMVTFTVAVEVFIIMVFAVATILATVIINVDDAYRNRHEVRCNKRAKSERARSLDAGDTALPTKDRTSKRRSARKEEAAHSSSKSSKSNVRVLECGGNVLEIDASLREDRGNCVKNQDLKCCMNNSPPSQGSVDEEGTKTDTITPMQLKDCINQEEINESGKCKGESSACGDIDKESKNFKNNASESLSMHNSDNLVNNNQFTLYRSPILVIQDNDKLSKKQNHHHDKDQSESNLNEISGNDKDSKDTNVPSTNCDIVETDSVSANQLVTSDCNDCRSEISNSKEDSSLSFVSTKKMFENNNQK